MTKRGRKPKAVVIHNDAGTMNSKAILQQFGKRRLQ
ncbi:hypothetical protein CoNPh25_CDS0042 [Staphylococcus phage S-CoN_Ph25]|nr:hypothetical protein CoNPh25_CDS0042 [Staphylococcus phage S-CoN_Ph25]